MPETDKDKEKDKGKDKSKGGSSLNVTLDINKTIDQAKDIISELWPSITSASTACAVAVANNTRFQLNLRGGFQWQGKTHKSADDIAPGKAGGWLIHSNGLDGSFSANVWKLETGSPRAYFVTVGQLVYATGAQSLYTVVLDNVDRYGGGKPESKDKMLALLDKGRSSSWRETVTVLANPSNDGAVIKIRVDITSQQGISNATNFIVTLSET